MKTPTQKIPVGVGSPSLFNLSGKRELREWCLVEVRGEDRVRFLQGQTTNDLVKLPLGEHQLSARLDANGRIVAFFILVKKQDCVQMLILKELAQSLVENLEKYVIMDDVTFKIQEQKLFFVFGPDSKSLFSLNSLSLGGGPGFLLTDQQQYENCPLHEVSAANWEKRRLLGLFPSWGRDIFAGQLFNESILDSIGVSYDKGCYIGQETTAKVHAKRGAAYFPMLLKLDSGGVRDEIILDGKKVGQVIGVETFQGTTYLEAKLLREVRVEERTFDFEGFQATVLPFPFMYFETFRDLAKYYYEQGTRKYTQEDQVETSIQFLEMALKLDPQLLDAYEGLGVILGNLGRFNEALQLMEKLEELAPEYAMANTNKSIYLMKLGKIPEAEAEKEKATVKSFTSLGKAAKQNRVPEQDEAEDKRREEMFQAVLEIDPEDTLALSGLGDLAFRRRQYELAEKYFKDVLAHDPRYSVAYLALGKTYEELHNTSQALITYRKGIEVAAQKGDLMPANEMQRRLINIQMV